MKQASARPSAFRLASWAALLLLTGACRDPFLHGSAGALEFLPGAVEFDPVFLGGEAQTTVELRNNGRSTLPLQWDALEPPFSVDELPGLAPAGTMTFTLRFRPEAAGPFTATLQGHSGELTVALALQGLANEPPGCGQPVACHQVAFDPVQGECVHTVVPDGSACDPHNVCISSASCVEGRCIGDQKACDDHNACTFDVCDPVRGCEHFTAAPCPGDGKCQLGVCDPVRGCALAPAADGTSCGPTRTCEAADVCIGGACVQRDPPDGFVCAPASPCQGEGRCAGASCERSAPVELQPGWSFDSMALTPDGGTEELHDMVVEPDGAVSLMSFFGSMPIARANTAGATRLSSKARRCILWNTRLVCADYPWSAGSMVTAVDPATGATQWSFDVTVARPDWVALAAPGRLFMARLASMGGDRLAALFEGYTLGKADPNECRVFFLVVLDAAGGMVAATQVTHPALELCNHPHPYGIAADVAGSLYLAFSPSLMGGAPLMPQTPTLLMSFSRDGVFRWQRTEQITGGELAVAQGRLYPENGGTAFNTLTGGVDWLLDPQPHGVFGRVVVLGDRVIPSPRTGTAQLWEYSTAGNLAWIWSLPAGQLFASDQLRLASWRYRADEPPQSIALTFVQRAAQPWLVAIDTRFAVEAWACPLGGVLRTAPQMLEVTHGAMALMEGSNQCGTCDPPFAYSQAAFHTYPLPGVELPFAPWTGTWGGPGHDHREDPLNARQGPPQ